MELKSFQQSGQERGSVIFMQRDGDEEDFILPIVAASNLID